jgi:hypothetical protein
MSSNDKPTAQPDRPEDGLVRVGMMVPLKLWDDLGLIAVQLQRSRSFVVRELLKNDVAHCITGMGDNSVVDGIECRARGLFVCPTEMVEGEIDHFLSSADTKE